MANHFDLLSREFCLSCGLGLPEDFLSDGVVSAEFRRQSGEVGVDNRPVRASHISVASNAILANVNLSRGICDFVDLLHGKSPTVTLRLFTVPSTAGTKLQDSTQYKRCERE